MASKYYMSSPPLSSSSSSSSCSSSVVEEYNESDSVKSVTLSSSPNPGTLIDNDIVIPQFHPNLIAPREDTFMDQNQGGSKCALIGKPNTGKSHFIRWLMYSKRKIFPSALVMSGTESCTGFYATMVPPLYIYNEYDQNALENFKKRQLLVRKSCSNPWTLLILDDCASSTKNFNGPIQQDLFKNGRHYKMLYLLGVQYPKDIPVTARSCFDGVFLFATGNSDVMKKLFEFAGDFPDKETFYKVFTEVTSVDHRALYIDYQNRNGKWFNNIYWAQAPHPKDIPDFKFGSAEYQAVAKDRVDFDRVRMQCSNIY
ncbi:hypothetical protein [Trichoplusia ni ascovirus 2c]|uniref:hypothetical protein n=1 Tax=Trichoplusia ni ascovirus 2c TaxID=328615 RepID=UPI0000E44237|nr:hypothetical protein TNAV2c_gp095 [Trichoplusia ni ascovirus 2c]ABF70612.1 hypothetical protein [Trichoplusia ni ascovirus 2c]AUS94201.1 ATPase [Trichoplusia ni ascovirus 6b]